MPAWREAQARRQFFAVDRDGLLVEGMPDLWTFKRRSRSRAAAVAGWTLRASGSDRPARRGGERQADRADRRLRPARHLHRTDRAHDGGGRCAAGDLPAVQPDLARSEATPQICETWSEGRAVIGTGSPFPPVMRNGKPFTVDQTNNAYVFPGVGLGVLAVGARRVSDGMFKARGHGARRPARRRGCDPGRQSASAGRRPSQGRRVASRRPSHAPRATRACASRSTTQAIDARHRRQDVDADVSALFGCAGRRSTGNHSSLIRGVIHRVLNR